MVSVVPLMTACILLELTAGASAQTPDILAPAALMRTNSQVRATWTDAWLHSDDPLEIAWGAWLVKLDRQMNFIPLLVQKVKEYVPMEEPAVGTRDRDSQDAMLEALDTLIQLNASVRVEDARKLYPEFAAQSLILLVRSPENAQSALFEIFDKAKTNWTWLAAGNVLFKQQAPGFARRLMDRLTQHVSVSVWDPGLGGGSGGGGSECGFSLREPKMDWPPVGLYQLTQFPGRIPWVTATFLIDGPTPVYYLRAEPGNYDNPPDSPGYCYDGDRDQYRAQYVTKLLQFTFPKISLDPYPLISIEWRDEINYAQRLSAAIEQQITAFHLALASLESIHLLTPDEASSLRPRVEVVISDRRRDRSVPLPDFGKSDGSVQVTAAFRPPLH
ncbi:MAG: hypothetical protein WB992_04640 [Bryobacteraceae bacterium]